MSGKENYVSLFTANSRNRNRKTMQVVPPAPKKQQIPLRRSLDVNSGTTKHTVDTGKVQL